MRHCVYLVIPFVLCIACSLAGCGEGASSAEATPASPAAAPTDTPAPAETPEETVRSLLALARAGDWGVYIERYYGEQHKFRPGHDDRGTLVERFTQRSDQIIGMLEQISGVEPVITEDGDLAVFHMPGDNRFQLFRAGDGRWMFHL